MWVQPSHLQVGCLKGMAVQNAKHSSALCERCEWCGALKHVHGKNSSHRLTHHAPSGTQGAILRKKSTSALLCTAVPLRTLPCGTTCTLPLGNTCCVACDGRGGGRQGADGWVKGEHGTGCERVWMRTALGQHPHTNTYCVA